MAVKLCHVLFGQGRTRENSIFSSFFARKPVLAQISQVPSKVKPTSLKFEV